jgi:hypothetical protein
MKAPSQKKPPGQKPQGHTKGNFGSDSSSATSASQQVATDTARNVRGTGNRYLETGSVDLQGAQVNSGIQGSHVETTINGLDSNGLAAVLSAFTQSDGSSNSNLGSIASSGGSSGATGGSAADLSNLANGAVSGALGSAGNAGTGAASSSGWKKYLTWQYALIAAGVVTAFFLIPKLLKKL